MPCVISLTDPCPRDVLVVHGVDDEVRSGFIVGLSTLP